MISLAVYTDVASFNLRHPRAQITGTTEPDTTDFAEWLIWATAVVNNFLRVTSNIADLDGIIKNIVDDLLMQKYTYEKLTGHVGRLDILNIPQPALTVEHKATLLNIKGFDDEPAYTRRMGFGYGYGGAELD